MAWSHSSVRVLPLDRPLWRAEVVGGLDGGRFAVLVVVHQVLADGLSGVRLVSSLLDPAADAKPGPGRHPVAGLRRAMEGFRAPLPASRCRDVSAPTGSWSSRPRAWRRPDAPGTPWR